LEFSGAEKISREQEGEEEEPWRKDSHSGSERIGIGYLEHNGGRFSMGKRRRGRMGRISVFMKEYAAPDGAFALYLWYFLQRYRP